MEKYHLRERVNVPVHGRCGERRSSEVQLSTRPGIEPGTFWLVIRDLTNCANLAHFPIPDVDECSVTGMCPNGRCVNKGGGYSCTCDNDFMPNRDGTGCIGKPLRF